jgi:hypothetical protein
LCSGSLGLWVRVRVRVGVGNLVRVAIIGIFLGFLGHIFDVAMGSCCMGSSQLQWVAIPMSEQRIVDWGRVTGMSCLNCRGCPATVSLGMSSGSH